MKPRPYQEEALNALNAHLGSKESNPCIVLPTGAGKSPFMAWTIWSFMDEYPPFRCIVLAHVKELVRQNYEKMKAIWPEAPAGIYSAGLKSRDTRSPILFAGIQSVYRRACELDPFDVIFVDEAHRIPMKGEGIYRQFISEARLCNPNVRVVGVTATPYRMDGGELCHRDHILNEIIYEANVKRLIDDGYLCKLRSKAGDATPDTSGLHIRSGEFVAAEVAAAVDPLVKTAVAEALGMLAGRKSRLWFCAYVFHAESVSLALAAHGINAPVIHAKTPHEERDRYIQQFTSGQINDLVNINVLSEGFDAQRIDAVVMLRPTASKGLYYQQVGRGLRSHPDKTDCLILDFAGNIERFGPIDAIEGDKVESRKCPDCKELFSGAMDTCPACGWFDTVECDGCGAEQKSGTATCEACGYFIIGKDCKHEDCKARNRMDAEICVNCNRAFARQEREIKHSTKASNASILSEPWTVAVKQVVVARHEKPGKPPSLKVTYQGEYESHHEWICLEHEGYAKAKAHGWWRRVLNESPPANVDEALGDLFGQQVLAEKIRQSIEWVRVKQSGRYTEVIGHGTKNGIGYGREAGAIAR